MSYRGFSRFARLAGPGRGTSFIYGRTGFRGKRTLFHLLMPQQWRISLLSQAGPVESHRSFLSSLRTRFLPRPTAEFGDDPAGSQGYDI